MTSSSGFKPMASSAKCKAAVHELTATAYFAPTYRENSVSNCFTFGPVVTQPERIASVTSAISVSSVSGRANGKKVERINKSFYLYRIFIRYSFMDRPSGVSKDRSITNPNFL